MARMQPHLRSRRSKAYERSADAIAHADDGAEIARYEIIIAAAFRLRPEITMPAMQHYFAL